MFNMLFAHILIVFCTLQSQSGKRKTDLAEIRICMDKQFKLIKCPHGDSTLYWSRLSQTQSCRGGEIYIPEIKRN